MSLVDRVCATLEHGDVEAQAAATMTAAFLIEKAMRRKSAGWDDNVFAEPIDHETIPRLRQALVTLTERHLISRPVSSAISALAVLDDRALVPLFIRCLRQHARAGSDVGILYEAMNALHRLGERVFPKNSSSLLDSEENLRVAVEYLKKKEPK